MSTIHIDEQGRVRLSAEIMDKAGVKPGDILEIDYVAGAIILNPINDVETSIMQFAGSCKGAWGDTPEEVESALATDRASWDR